MDSGSGVGTKSGSRAIRFRSESSLRMVGTIAPATANILAKMAHGLADDLLSSVALATRAPILVAPAMNTGMYENLATQANFETLKSRGVHFVEMDTGDLACGTTGKGRMADPAAIFAAAQSLV